MSLAITDAVLGGQVVGLRVEDGVITELGPSVGPRVGDEVIDTDGLLQRSGRTSGGGARSCG